MSENNTDASKPVQGQAARLEDFEKAVYGRAHVDRIAENTQAMVALHQCLIALREGYGFEGYPRLDTSLITRFVSAVTTLWLDPQFTLTQEGFDYIAADRVVLDTAFRASVYGNSDHLCRMIPENDESATKYLLLFCLGSNLEMDWEQVFRMDPQATAPLWLSLISYGQVVSPQAHERREKLLAMAPIFENVKLPASSFNTLCGAYMHCSYASGRDKHACKRVFHKMLANLLQEIPRQEFGVQVRKDRPRILIVHEWWWSKHAMYRSYSRSIQQLRKNFYLIGACAGKNTDPEARAMFDEWIELDSERMIISDVYQKLRATNPDIVYYPSIGMSVWVIAMASMRIAPIQVMTYGHPATSNSPEIDYGLIEADCYVPDRFSEKVIPLPPNVVRPTEYEPVPYKHKPRATDTVKIGVTAMQVKLSWPFVRAMQEVQRRSKKTIEFYFCSAAYGIGLHSLASELSALLENVTVQEKQPYGEYMESLSECDLALFSFPFGGANSTYDALTLGLPMVSLEGDEPHSRSDASILRRSGLPETLIAKSEQEYIETVLRMVDDDTFRAETAGQIARVNVEQQFYKPDESEAFLNAFLDIYRANTVEQAA